MTNLFALLGKTPRPWLDPDELKTTYLALTAREHPDAPGASADFAQINLAYQTLSDPPSRLRHLLDLHSPPTSTRTQPIPEDILPFFTPVAEITQSVDTFLKTNAAATSPLARALLSPQQYQLQDRLQASLADLQQKHDTLLTQLREADTLWQSDPGAALPSLPPLWQSLSFTTKWLGTLRESLFRLASL